MSLIKAVVRNGRLETDAPIDLPDGTELLIPVFNGTSDDEPGWDSTPEGIADWLKWYDSLQPLKIDANEEAEAQAWLKKCSAHGKPAMEKGLDDVFP